MKHKRAKNNELYNVPEGTSQTFSVSLSNNGKRLGKEKCPLSDDAISSPMAHIVHARRSETAVYRRS